MTFGVAEKKKRRISVNFFTKMRPPDRRRTMCSLGETAGIRRDSDRQTAKYRLVCAECHIRRSRSHACRGDRETE